MVDPKVIARAIQLRYVSDAKPGIRRERDTDQHFTYFDPHHHPITDEAELTRIAAIGIPPAWEQVWISPYPNGHILATGRDQKGRKQYRYHPKWHAHQSKSKFDHLARFGASLPIIRQTVDQHLRLRGLPREKVLAIVVSLLDHTLIRIGNSEYVRQNESYGLTTLQDDHVAIHGQKVAFSFRGKSGKDHTIDLQDRRLAKLIKACRDIPGYDLFQYYDDQGESWAISSGDVNDYLRQIAEDEFTAKDFRTWGGSALAVEALCDLPACESETSAKKAVAQAIKRVAVGLGNTPAVCRKYYIHPAVIQAYVDGTIHQILIETAEHPVPEGLDLNEAALLRLIQATPG